jgi:cytochrome c oxidase subunit II
MKSRHPAVMLHLMLLMFALACFGARASAPELARQGDEPVREVHVTAARFKFSPDVLAAVQNETVRIVVRSVDVTHGFEMKALGIDREIPRGGEPVEIEFTPGRSGTFEITCSEYCGIGHDRMKAVLLVRPAHPTGDGL